MITIRSELSKTKPVFLTLSKQRQDALIEMGFQMGVEGLLRFERMWQAIEAGDFETAYSEALDSRWAKQTPKRAIAVAKLLR